MLATPAKPVMMVKGPSLLMKLERALRDPEHLTSVTKHMTSLWLQLLQRVKTFTDNAH